MTEPVEQVAEVIEEVGPEIVETTAAVVRSLTKVKLQFAVLGAAAGAATGALVAFKVAYKKAEKKYEKIIEEDVASVKDYYARKANGTQDPPLAEVVEELGYKQVSPDQQQMEYVKPAVRDIPPEEAVEIGIVVEETSVTTGVTIPNWDYKAELSSRTATAPYVIHKDEFAQGNFHGERYFQQSLTYFGDDDVLIDSADNRLEDIDGIVGLANLERFGHGSEDARVVYIRNDAKETDYEVLLSGSYASEVQGVDDTLQHSATIRGRRQHEPMGRRRGWDDD